MLKDAIDTNDAYPCGPRVISAGAGLESTSCGWRRREKRNATASESWDSIVAIAGGFEFVLLILNLLKSDGW